MTATKSPFFTGAAKRIALVGGSLAALVGGTTHAADLPRAAAPIGVFGVDTPMAGKIMVSLLPTFTLMQGSKIGRGSVSPAFIVSTVGSPDTPVGAHLLRMVPNHIDVDAQGFSIAYGLTRNVTLFAATMLVEKSVEMEAFQGLNGLTSLGFSTGSTSGLGDTTIATIVRVREDTLSQVKLNMGLSLPTGATTDNIVLLLPNGTAPAKRGFYAMQPGSGTVDLLPGVTYSGASEARSWGLSYRSRLPLNLNAQGWKLGDQHEFNAWGGYSWTPGLETTLRLNATVQGAIRGEDPIIRGYAQGSDPRFYGGEQVSVFGGLIVDGRYFGQPAVQAGVEAGAPVYQRLNGPQLGRAWQLHFVLRYKL